MKIDEVDLDKISPMMSQYIDIKKEHASELLFFRLGDFYELFFEDATIASKELELTLTGKNAGLEERIPMCGVPYHSVKPYIEKLVSRGYKVAICEQLEDPRKTKGVVKRGVVEIISIGTRVDNELLNSFDHNYIASIIDYKYLYVLTYADISTGSLNVINLEYNKESLINEVLALNIKEIVLVDNTDVELTNILKNVYGININISNNYLEEKYDYLTENITDIRLKKGVEHLLYYLTITEMKEISHFTYAKVIDKTEYLELNINTIRNLELIETIRLKERTNSLIWLIDKCKTAMGSRRLKDMLLNPLRDINQIEKRYNMIETLNNQFILKDELGTLLNNVYDLERLCGKVICGNLNGRDLIQLKNSFKPLPRIKEIINLLEFDYQIDTFSELYSLLESSINEDAPITIKDGNIIKYGYDKELDELKDIRKNGKNYISSFESTLKDETGIRTLKVGFNKVFGYFIEVSKGQVNLVKDEYNWERRQTLTNCERYISPSLKEKENMILNAEERIVVLEYELFLKIKEIVKEYVNKIKNTASELSKVDAILSLSVVSDLYNFTRPKLNNKSILEIVDGRHPVIEVVSKDEYIPNSIYMDNSVNSIIITGPNMSGKSTYMRQTAIIVILAQMGSFIPAKSANIMVFDKIFTRIGASDDLVSGESTFMVEMKESVHALNNATDKSLIIFDELGRGTATYDGISLAEAILLYANNKIKCKTLFSTHYHELTKLERKYPKIKNVHVSALEENGTITFLHKIKPGSVDKSYGIHVAKLAGMKDSILENATEILNSYEKNIKKDSDNKKVQLTLLMEEKKSPTIDDILKDIEPLNMTPIEAINTLYELKNKYNKTK